jgi:DNA-binding GntR family transcriptional regulator
MGRPARAQSPLARRSSGELVADRLRRQIITGELEPNQRLNQEDIAAQLGTSRVPVREALVILEQEGFVKMEMQRGGFVLPIETSVTDNAEVWDLIFGLVARRAVARLTPDLEARLSDIAGDLRATHDPTTITALSEDYLDGLFDASSAPSVARTIRKTRAMAIDSIVDVAPDTVVIVRAGTLEVHNAILDRDAERANTVHSNMQRDCLELLLKAFKDRGQ